MRTLMLPLPYQAQVVWFTMVARNRLLPLTVRPLLRLPESTVYRMRQAQQSTHLHA